MRPPHSSVKQIDRLLLKSFVGPFLVAFAIALFAFLMQYLWVYIDEIIGKGASLLLIAELIGYLSVSMMPMALPVAVLIASVMTMGNLAEHYELASMKSAGVPLLRIMAPLMLAGFAITAFSFVCSNNLIPVANLKARTRLYDIRKQKPSLSLEEGAFNDDFQGFAIRIGRKVDDAGALEDVMLFRQGGTLRGRIEGVTATKGEMSVTPDERYFVLDLEDGYQYQEPAANTNGGRRTYPFVRTRFETYRKTFDLSEFEMKRTDESAFQDHQGMLSVGQLAVAIDSIRDAMEQRRDRLGIETGRFVAPLKRRDRAKLDSIEQLKRDSIKLAEDLAIANDDSAAMRGLRADAPRTAAPAAPALSVLPPVRPGFAPKPRRRPGGGKAADRAALAAEEAPRLRATNPVDEAGDYRAYVATRANYKKSTYFDRATQFARTVRSYADGAQRRLEAQRQSLVHHVYELHLKFSFAAACFIFLFIGAPMGAIIRKGGFGYPILVSIIFFTVFIILMIMGKKLMASYTLQPGFAAWLPTIVIFPIGVLLTYSAMNDIKFSLAERLGRSKAWQWVVARLNRGGPGAGDDTDGVTVIDAPL